MIIKIKNKDTLNIGAFKLKCSLGKKGISKYGTFDRLFKVIYDLIKVIIIIRKIKKND